ncbi:MAG: hypothetical protein ABFD89_25060 [Bryobacteraceae bacterium]
MKPLLAIAIILSAAPVHADFLYKLVGYECDTKANAVILHYVAGFNEAGKSLKETKGPQEWDPWSLIKTKNDWIQSTKTVGGRCELTDGAYDITIGPLPGNANLQGACGGAMSAWAEVKRGTETVLKRHMFESPDCHFSVDPVTVRIVIEPGKEPAITQISRDEFYQRAQNPPARPTPKK